MIVCGTVVSLTGFRVIFSILFRQFEQLYSKIGTGNLPTAVTN
jgi:hypothetical protein